MARIATIGLLLLATSAGPGRLFAESPAPARGEAALLKRPLLAPAWSVRAYQDAWKHWGIGARPVAADYDAKFAEHYGLATTPFQNHGLPMGMKESSFLGLKGITADCLLCHGGSIAGQSYVGLGNASVDIQALFEDLAAADGRPAKLPFVFGRVRGTTEAGAMAAYLLGWREPDLQMRSSRLDLGVHDDLCLDTPPWWHLKKKKTMYMTGSMDARSVRANMQFMMSPLTPPSRFKAEEGTFADIQAYLLQIQPPRYPFHVDASLARRGESLFLDHCKRCHGTYGAQWTYPNKIVPLEEIGTDSARFLGVTTEHGRYYNRSWFGQEQPGWLIDEYLATATSGYQAPPLDGIWATAPYFHNGSVPTVYQVLNSQARPSRFTRSFKTDEGAYDPVHLGWKVEEVRDQDTARKLAAQRRLYDVAQPGRGNRGHTYGDSLTDAERLAIIEYLKTL